MKSRSSTEGNTIIIVTRVFLGTEDFERPHRDRADARFVFTMTSVPVNDPLGLGDLDERAVILLQRSVGAAHRVFADPSGPDVHRF